MYSIDGYGEMIADDVRTDAYVEALRRAVRPGAVVLDIGTGTGLFALLACRFGARRVFAVEPGDVIDVARRIAAANQCDGAIEFVQAMSKGISLPERVDVIVSDLRGVLPYFQQHLPAIADARRRFLLPGGVLIPEYDTVWLACVEAPALHRNLTVPWSDNKYGLDMQAARELQANRWRRAVLESDQMMTTPRCCGRIDYSTVENPNLDVTVVTAVTRAGSAHGIGSWFDATLADGIHYSNAPGAPPLIYGNVFFPWPEPVALAAGDTVTINLSAHLIGEEYLWSWESRIQSRDSGEERAHFKQSDFFGAPLPLARVRKQAADHVPELTEDGRIDRLILELMNEGLALGEIARQVSSRFNSRYGRWHDALAKVAALSARYSS